MKRTSPIIWMITCITLAIVSPQLWANDTHQQCFIDVQSAYQHLIVQEKPHSQSSNTKYPSNEQTNRNIIQTININTATEAELVTLKGIGSKKATNILLYREMIGTFSKVDELTNIKGIGIKTVEKNRTRLSVK